MEMPRVDTGLQNAGLAGPVNGGGRDAPGASFSQFVKNAVSEVDSLKHEADKAVFDLATGKNQDIHNTMIAVEKAGVAFELMAQVRNKVIAAYEEVMRMQF
jgi:flagellar hook-basal body complex protein FliE